MRLKYLPKRLRGGRSPNVATFCTACDQQVSNASIQGLANLGGKVVKLMLDGHMARQEKKTLDFFREKPHVNIVRGFCAYDCNDNPIRWHVPPPFCTGGNGKFVVVVQEFIHGGTLADFTDWTDSKWCSIVLQLTFACLEWYDSYKYLYMDWHSGNVLMDMTDDATATYVAFGKTWHVAKLDGVRPVVTDFSRGVIFNAAAKVHPWAISYQLGIIWDMIKHTAPPAWKQRVSRLSIEVGERETLDDVLTEVNAFVAMVSPAHQGASSA